MPQIDRVLSDTAFEYGSPRGYHPIFSRLYLPSLMQVKGSTAVLTAPGANCYYHWMLEILPKLALLEKSGLKADRYFVGQVKYPYMIDSLKHLGIASKLLIGAPRCHLE